MQFDGGSKINTHWDEDIYGNSILVVEKGRGKLNFDEVADLLRYDWKLQGHYVMLINATEATCGVDWDPFGEIEKKEILGNFTVLKNKKNARYVANYHHIPNIARSAGMK